MSTLPAIQPHPTLHQTVNARELHAFLEIGKDFSTWIKVQINRAGIIENEDFVKLTQKRELSATGQSTIEYHLTLESGKHIAMMSQAKKGREVRNYFIECEKVAMQSPQQPAELSYDEIMNRALTMSSAKIHALQSANAELETQVEQIKPKAEALDRIASITGSLCLTDAAKVLQIKPKALIGYLSAHKWIFKRMGTAWLGFQCRIDQGVLEHKVIAIYSGSQKRMREQVRVTPKGLARLAEVFAMEAAA